MIRAVTLDVHGTLILPTPSVGELYAERGRLHGVDITVEQLEQAFVPAFRAVAQNWDIPYGRNEDDARAFWYAVINGTFDGRASVALQEDLFTWFGTGACWQLLPQARAVLDFLTTENIPFAICSNFDARVRRILNDLDIHTEHFFISSEVGAAKPNPLMLEQAAKAMGAPITEVLHIGDNPKEDGKAAAAAGCQWLPVDRETGIDIDQLVKLLQHA